MRASVVSSAPVRSRVAVAVLAASLAACSDDTGQLDVTAECPEGERLERGVCVSGGGGDVAGADALDPDAAGDPVVIDLTGGDVVSVDLPVGETAGDCADGARSCSELGRPLECVGGVWIEGDACGAGQICVGGRCVEGEGCTPGTVAGCWDETAQRACNSGGTALERVPCADGLYCFRGACGAQRCEPSQLGCDESGRWVQMCAPSGTEWVRTEECNPRDNLACVGGECVSGCAAALKNPTYIGCEYWSVDLPQYQDPFGDPRAVPHAVVVANTGDRPANITIDTRGDVPVVTASATVAPGEVATLNFPRADVENTSRSRRSFRISTDEPVVAYQFNPLNDVGVASNDASLLLPASAIGREYYVMSYPSGIGAMGFAPQTGWFTVVAPREGETVVTITFSAKVLATTGTGLLSTPADMSGILAGQTRTYRMQQYDVLNFEAESTFAAIGDLTGTHVESDRPVVVFGGHEEAVIGDEGDGGGPCCADHLEEQIFPVETWGQRYLAVHSPPRGNEIDVWRVVAARDGTRVTTNPPVAGLDGRTLDAGGFIEVETRQSFEIIGSQPILVGQYLVSQLDVGITDTKGDPAFILAVPAEQFRADYAVLVPRSYEEDWITVVRPAGAPVTLDGVLIPDAEFTAFGSGEYQFSYRRVAPGPHALACATEEGFGIAGFGYNNAVSYGYPGGMNLATEFSESAP